MSAIDDAVGGLLEWRAKCKNAIAERDHFKARLDAIENDPCYRLMRIAQEKGLRIIFEPMTVKESDKEA
jgi:hypothetical protein